MRKYTYNLLLLLILFSVEVNSQSVELTGVTKYSFNDSKIYLTNAFHEKYYEEGKVLDSSTVDKDGVFMFRNSQLSPQYPYKFINKDKGGYDSTPFFLASSQNYKIEIHRLDSLSINNDIIYSKEKKEFDLFFQDIKDRYKKLYNNGDQAITKYGGMQNIPEEYFISYRKSESEIISAEKERLNVFIMNHPNSYYAFWTYVYYIEKNIYNPYETKFLLSKFSKVIQQSFPAKEILKSLEKKIFEIGQKFPKIIVSDINNHPAAFKIDANKKYTLIEFWFSHCVPCRRDLPKYLKLYNQFYKSGFTIINIATDRAQDLPYLRKTIKDFNIKWTQYLDENERQCKILGIESYPTNFLLDSNSEIVASNISVDELKNFLSENLLTNE